MSIIEKHKNAFDKFLTLKSYAYYVIVPTYCYQLVYHKTTTFRLSYLLQKTLRLLALSLVSLFIFLEYTFPLLSQSKKYFTKPLDFFEIYPYVC